MIESGQSLNSIRGNGWKDFYANNRSNVQSPDVIIILFESVSDFRKIKTVIFHV